MQCIFCKIVNKEVATNVIYEDNNIMAFDDINPQAPIHKLIIPKRHIATINDLTEEDSNLAGNLVLLGQKIAIELKISEKGYRLLFNCNREGGQDVFHIHLHLLGGRAMHWPPG